MNMTAISWSYLQPTVAVLNVEAQYLSAHVVKEALRFCKLWRDFGLDLGPVQIYCNKQEAIGFQAANGFA